MVGTTANSFGLWTIYLIVGLFLSPTDGWSSNADQRGCLGALSTHSQSINLDQEGYIHQGNVRFTPRVIIERAKAGPHLKSIRELSLEAEGMWLVEVQPQFADYGWLRNLIKGFTGEIQLIKFHDIWLATVSFQPHTMWIPEINQFKKLISFDLHSHPGTDELAEMPSFEDAGFLSNGVGKMLIMTNLGLLQFEDALWDTFPKNAQTPYTLWKHWIVDILKLDEAEFEKRGPVSLQQEFFRQFFKLKYLNEAEIASMFLGLK